MSKKKGKDNQHRGDQSLKAKDVIGPIEKNQAQAAANATQQNKRQPQNVGKEARIALIISGIALIASVYQGCIAREALHYSQRAYLFPDFARGLTYISPGQPINLTIPIVNSGHTAAHEAATGISMDFYDGPDFPKGDSLPPPLLGTPKGIYPSVNIIQPVTGKSRISESDFERLQDGQTKIYVWGLFEYESFGEYFFTKFCYFGVYHKNFPTPEWMYTPCDEGNDSN